MNRPLLAALALSATGAATVVAVLGGPAQASPTTAFQTTLLGANEAPAAGDPDGRGNAVVRVDAATGEICWNVTTHGTADLVAGHLHRKAPGAQSGPVVQAFALTTSDSLRGCAVNLAVASGLLADPAEYYVNVHTADFPAGAMRGDLG